MKVIIDQIDKYLKHEKITYDDTCNILYTVSKSYSDDDVNDHKEAIKNGYLCQYIGKDIEVSDIL